LSVGIAGTIHNIQVSAVESKAVSLPRQLMPDYHKNSLVREI